MVFISDPELQARRRRHRGQHDRDRVRRPGRHALSSRRSGSTTSRRRSRTTPATSRPRYEIASEGLEEHGESARLHYNLACYAARGRHQELALHHLDQATKLDAELVRTWSADDHDLDSIRERAGL